MKIIKDFLEDIGFSIKMWFSEIDIKWKIHYAGTAEENNLTSCPICHRVLEPNDMIYKEFHQTPSSNANFIMNLFYGREKCCDQCSMSTGDIKDFRKFLENKNLVRNFFEADDNEQQMMMADYFLDRFPKSFSKKIHKKIKRKLLEQ